MSIENDIFLSTEEMIVGKAQVYFPSHCIHQVGTNCMEIFYHMINRNYISAVVKEFKVIFPKINLFFTK